MRMRWSRENARITITEKEIILDIDQHFNRALKMIRK